MAKQLREGEIDALVARYREIRSMRKLATEFGLSRTTIAKHLADRGINTSRGMTSADIARAADLYEGGLSSVSIGKRLGYDNKTILSALRAEGITIREALVRYPTNP